MLGSMFVIMTIGWIGSANVKSSRVEFSNNMRFEDDTYVTSNPEERNDFIFSDLLEFLLQFDTYYEPETIDAVDHRMKSKREIGKVEDFIRRRRKINGDALEYGRRKTKEGIRSNGESINLLVRLKREDDGSESFSSSEEYDLEGKPVNGRIRFSDEVIDDDMGTVTMRSKPINETKSKRSIYFDGYKHERVLKGSLKKKIDDSIYEISARENNGNSMKIRLNSLHESNKIEIRNSMNTIPTNEETKQNHRRSKRFSCLGRILGYPYGGGGYGYNPYYPYSSNYYSVNPLAANPYTYGGFGGYGTALGAALRSAVVNAALATLTTAATPAPTTPSATTTPTTTPVYYYY